MRHTIVSMTRGDGHKIGEWLQYHADLGINEFHIVLDGDIDGTQDLLASLSVAADVFVHPRPEVGEYYDGMSRSERRERVALWRERHAVELAAGTMRGTDALAWRQHLHFAPILARYASGEHGDGWLSLIDVDEFIVLRQHRTIGELLVGQAAPRVRLLNFNVDTTGYDSSRPVLDQHALRWSRQDLLAYKDTRWANRFKSVVRYRCATLNSTVHKISRGASAVIDPEVGRLHHFKMPVAELDIPFTVYDPVRPVVPTGRKPGPAPAPENWGGRRTQG